MADTTLERSRLFFFIAGASAAAVAVLIGMMMGKRLTSPIVALTGTVGRMRDGDLSIRATISRRDEIGVLADQFNNLADRLEKNITDLKAERDSLKAFTENASHELRTPITALQTFVELLSGKSGDDPQTRREFLKDSEKQIERLEWTIHSLLSLTRMDGDLVELSMENIPVRELIEEAIQDNAGQIAAKALCIQGDDIGEHVTARCDRRYLVTALSNIINNAVKYSPDKGEIRVAGFTRGNSVVIRISDDGPGIDPTDLPHIFQRFYRSLSSTEEGSGLGLALVDSIVRLHGGRIDVDSAPGSGSTFSLVLPADAAAVRVV